MLYTGQKHKVKYLTDIKGLRERAYRSDEGDLVIFPITHERSEK